jgi:two-component system NtrC family sensor kinase
LVSIARNKGLVQYSNFTANLILYSSACELILFSVALADRINFYRKQNNEAQAVALTIARENERLITGQNFALENKVKERTQELIESNRNLSTTIENLKSAQIQLIDTEKMASLGQLTAGIAHEINNPINFVSANIKPLRMDFAEIFNLMAYYRELAADPANTNLQQKVNDYSKEIDIDFIKAEVLTLLDGIEDGASRTTEIVQSLRTFSRTDEPTLKPTDINRSILTTLVLLRSTIPYDIEIKPLLDKLPLLNCYPGKINQVFVNLINNSIQAIKAKPVHQNEHILITTKDYPENIVISITDTGAGMTEEVKQHIFDPFYTTKDIGEGTGLGLSIVFGIIEKHHGMIEVVSKPGEGTTFTVMLPKTLE